MGDSYFSCVYIETILNMIKFHLNFTQGYYIQLVLLFLASPWLTCYAIIINRAMGHLNVQQNLFSLVLCCNQVVCLLECF